MKKLISLMLSLSIAAGFFPKKTGKKETTKTEEKQN